MLLITDSKAQSPAAGFSFPGLVTIPCLYAFAIAFFIICDDDCGMRLFGSFLVMFHSNLFVLFPSPRYCYFSL